RRHPEHSRPTPRRDSRRVRGRRQCGCPARRGGAAPARNPRPRRGRRSARAAGSRCSWCSWSTLLLERCIGERACDGGEGSPIGCLLKCVITPAWGEREVLAAGAPIAWAPLDLDVTRILEAAEEGVEGAALDLAEPGIRQSLDDR